MTSGTQKSIRWKTLPMSENVDKSNYGIGI